MPAGGDHWSGDRGRSAIWKIAGPHRWRQSADGGMGGLAGCAPVRDERLKMMRRFILGWNTLGLLGNRFRRQRLNSPHQHSVDQVALGSEKLSWPEAFPEAGRR